MKWCNEYSIKHRVMVRATQIRSRLVSLCAKFGIPLGKSGVEEEGLADRIVKCIVSGFFANAAVMLPDTSYRLIRGSVNVNFLFILPDIHFNDTLYRIYLFILVLCYVINRRVG